MIKHRVYFIGNVAYVLTSNGSVTDNTFRLVRLVIEKDVIEFANVEIHSTYMFCLYGGMFYSTKDISRMKQDLIKRNSRFNKIWKFLRIFKLRLSLLQSKIKL